MGSFFSDFRAAPNDRRPPTEVRLLARLRTHAGSDRVIIAFELEPDNDVWFEDAPNHRGRHKRIEFRGTVDSDGTPFKMDVPLFCGPRDQARAALIRAEVLPAGGGSVMNVAADEIFIR